VRFGSAVLLAFVALRAHAAEPWKTAPLPPPMPEPAAHGQVEHDGARLWWASFGKGAPVVLLHGGSGNSDHWANQVPALAARFQVIVIDSRGHGRSTRDGQPLSYHQLAGDVVAVLDALKLERASVVGWSDGGVVALDLALTHPTRVAKVVAFGANFDLSGMKPGGGPAFAAYFEKCAQDYQRLSPTPKDYQAFRAELGKMWRSQPTYPPEQLATITAPTLILDGDHEEIIRPEHTRALARLIPGAKLVILPQSSHFAHWQHPDAFNRALLDFL